MASAANAPCVQENRDPERPRITRRNRGDYGRNTPLDLEYLHRPSYCDAGFALEQISEVLMSYMVFSGSGKKFVSSWKGGLKSCSCSLFSCVVTVSNSHSAAGFFGTMWKVLLQPP